MRGVYKILKRILDGEPREGIERTRGIKRVENVLHERNGGGFTGGVRKNWDFGGVP